MKRFLLMLSCSGALLLGTELPGVRSVYVMPMSQGMDQFLANRLAGEHAFQVVSDVKLADAVLTDRIGPSLNASLEEAAPKPAVAEDKDKDDKKGPALKNTLDNPSLSATFGHGKGTFFLVDAKSRQVIWSTFEVPKNSTASQLDRTASDIVSRLMHDLKKK